MKSVAVVVTNPSSVVWLQTRYDHFLLACFLVFAFTALVFEPLFYYGCQWNAHTCYYATYSPFIGHIRDIWKLYLQFDPIFFDLPLWLRVLCTIEVWVFGPLYLLVSIAMLTNASWLDVVALPFCGALIYSTLVYFAMEVLDVTAGTDLWVVFLVNVPWTIVPALLIARIYEKRRNQELKVSKSE